MRIGIISDSDSLIPLVYTLAVQKLQVCIYFVPSNDSFINQKVRAFAKQINLAITEERNKDRDLYIWLNKNTFDVSFIIGYKHFIKMDKLHYNTQLFNIHFSPLPSFRGPTPVFWQLKQGVEKLGLCIHRLSDKFDAGEVVWIKDTMNYEYFNCKLATQLLSQLCVEGALSVVRLITNGMPVPAIDRSHIKPTCQKRPGLIDVLINWQEMDAVEICNLIRACNPWNKGAITSFKGQEVKLMDALVVKHDRGEADKAGTVVKCDMDFFVQCRDNRLIKINMLFFQDSYIASYQCSSMGFHKGDCFS